MPALILFLMVLRMMPLAATAATLPAGFNETVIPGPNSGGTWNEIVGLTFEGNGRLYAWERGGRVWIQERGSSSWTKLLDISEEVGGWRDFGLLGVTLDPNFRVNGHIYLLYVVDRHHLMNHGTPNYNPATDEYFAATIGRITRYTARSSDGFTTVDPASRRVLVGETRSTGFPITHQSHGVGSLVFGTDGTLLASCGDGACYNHTDVGSDATDTYYQQALNDGIIRAKENVGAFRSQLVDCLNGKVIRIDPATGDGIPGNPFYDVSSPRSAKSRVWALGLRNPCRMTLRPGTGSHDRTDANPGILYIGDVGWSTWEDLHVCTGPGQNFGWPLFEGLTEQTSYRDASPQNLDAPNPLYPGTGCSQYFRFRDLLKQDTQILANKPPFANPCNTTVKIPSTIPQFLHRRPELDWRHGSSIARTGIFDASGNASTIAVGDSGSPVAGSQFPGNCSIGGVWYTATDFPAQYRNTYFHAEYGATWIKNFVFDAADKPTAVRDFLASGGGIVAVDTHPIDGGLYYISWASTLRRIAYTATGNRAPTAVATADRLYGPGPLTIQFNGSASIDPEAGPLTYSWNLGDGSPVSTAANPGHTFAAPAGVPTRYDVTLTVTDNGGLSSQAGLVISVNNTPPTVTITSPADGTRYPLSGDTTYPLTASVTDTESGDGALLYQWQTILHHNDHQHSDPIDTNHQTTTVISPVGCDGNTYYYRIVLTVTDPAGLSTQREVRLYPDCPNQPPQASFSATPSVGIVPLQVSFDGRSSTDPEGSALSHAWNFGDGTFGTGATPVHTYTATGTYEATLTVTDAGGATDTASLNLSVNPVPPPGLDGTYFDNADLTNPKLSRNDSTIDFDWGSGSPDPLISADTFSVRWLGRIEPLYSETYTFYAVTDDGFRLWVNNQMLIDSWIDQAPTERAGTPIALTAGTRYDIKIEYYENGGGAVARLLWSSASQTKGVVPAGRLFPPSTAVPATLTWPNPAPISYGTPLGATQLNATANTAGTFAYTPPAGTVLNAGNDQILSVDFTPIDLVNYLANSTTTAIDVSKASLTIQADDKSRLEGEPNPPLTATYTGFVNGDSPARLDTAVVLTTTASVSSPPGNYPITANGASDANYAITHVNGMLTITAAPSFTGAKINFQPASAPIPPGYLPDGGNLYGNRGNGLTYGWNANNTGQTKDRNSPLSPDQRYDTLIYMQKGGSKSWEIAVPNGSYQVRIVAGDAKEYNSIFRIAAEGVLTVSGTTTSSSRWFDSTQTVTVTDGRLTISNASGAKNNKICFVEITPLSASPSVAAATSRPATASLQVLKVHPDGSVLLQITGLSESNAVLESSEDLLRWTEVSHLSGDANQIEFLDAPSAPVAHRFYRVVTRDQ